MKKFYIATLFISSFIFAGCAIDNGTTNNTTENVKQNQELEKHKKHFSKIDSDSNGVITSDEAKKYHTSKFAQMDVNDDGFIMFSEFNPPYHKDESKRLEMFFKIDTSNDLILTLDEYMAKKAQCFGKLDENQDRDITQAEFLKSFTKAHDKKH